MGWYKKCQRLIWQLALIQRLALAASLMVTGLAGVLTLLSTAIQVTFTVYYEATGETLWLFLLRSETMLQIFFWSLIYLAGLVFLLRYGKPSELDKTEEHDGSPPET